MQYGFDFDLWTCQIARDLIDQHFGVTLSLASEGALLARVGLTPQKAVERAHQRDPEAIAHCSEKPTRRLPATSPPPRTRSHGLPRARHVRRGKQTNVRLSRGRPGTRVILKPSQAGQGGYLLLG